MSLDTTRARNCLKGFEFERLFIEELGWDRHSSSLPVAVNGFTFELRSVAQKRGVQIFVCPPDAQGRIPDYATRRKIEKQVTKSAYEHLLIFVDGGKSAQVWQWVARQPGQPAQYREHPYHPKSQSGDALVQKLSHIYIPLDEDEALDLTGATHRLRDAFDRDRVTKKFYERFKAEHTAFLKFVKGIKEQGDKEWYASLMLNRLMFVYFIQRKGFLDDNLDYLRDRLAKVKARKGKVKFLTFYQYFLKALFHQGFACEPQQRKLEADLAALIGAVPYLNGGLFDVHELEENNPNLDVPDEAFERLFAFFDEWDWHLDTRPLRNDREINPDVLGYIFEKYINQKQMGAYYTKEDITEYISKNTIIPFLFDAAKKKCAIAFEPGSALWRLLRDDPDRYIYPAVRHGVLDAPYQPEAQASEPAPYQPEAQASEPAPYQPEAQASERSTRPASPASEPPQSRKTGESTRLRFGLVSSSGIIPLPPEIEAGVTDVSKRSGWNKPAPEPYALPTETWREHVARRQRCLDLRAKLAAGEIREINDLITYNLNIRQFAEDCIAECEGPELLRAFWHAIRDVTVLDPTCGSGAFLFAALGILQPLYEACLDRMQAFVEDLDRSGERHSPKKFEDFRAVLADVQRHPNRDYFILKSLVVRNLYGVDIMEEAVEICKLRLFLKLVAQVETVGQIEPLPDIDFNIRPGNTLVGYATLDHVRKTLAGTLGFLKDDVDEIVEEAEIVDRAFRLFHEMQTQHGMDGQAFASAKQELRVRLNKLSDKLDRFLAGEYGIDAAKKPNKFAEWCRSHEPFHWLAEFYGIMNDGGFSVIIGNPPYVELKAVVAYETRGYQCVSCGNLYALVLERCADIVHPTGYQGYIVPVSSVSTDRYEVLQKKLAGRALWFSSFDDRPSRLFDGLEHIRLTIHIIGSRPQPAPMLSSRYNKWNAVERPVLFEQVSLVESRPTFVTCSLPKLCSPLEHSILSKLSKQGKRLSDSYISRGGHEVYYSRKVGYFLQVLNFEPKVLDGRGKRRPPSEFKTLAFGAADHAWGALCCLNSSLFYWFVTVFSDCRHVNKREVDAFPVDLAKLAASTARPKLQKLGAKLMADLDANSEIRKMRFAHDELTVQCIIPKASKPIIDEIDSVLAEYYGLTEVERDFMVNYDIKYRMGQESGNEDEE